VQDEKDESNLYKKHSLHFHDNNVYKWLEYILFRPLLNLFLKNKQEQASKLILNTNLELFLFINIIKKGYYYIK
jgi:hypothetical protein